MPTRATVLCENSVFGNVGAMAEHGWSVWLETDGGIYLFDTGQGTTIINNAQHFGVDLSDAVAIMLSHHHIDHTGGLLATLTSIRRMSGPQTIPVYAHPDLFKHSVSENKGKFNYIAMPHTRGVLEIAGAEFRLDAGWREVGERVYLSGEVPRVTRYEHGDQNLKHYDARGELVVDPIRDDQTVIVDTPEGLFVILGCAHAGLINILTHVREQTGSDRFHTVMGGTHLGPVSEEQVEQTIAALHEFDIAHLGVSHCTGPKVASRIAHEFGERFFHCNVGTVVTI